MYIIVFETGSIHKTETISDNDKNGADDGILDIINTDTMKQYVNGEWVDIDPWETEDED